ncbi:MAG: hypothetical protein JO010_07915 [Alphaproteobacteria bacterium]|nr:hypothetical protein [Alphaproteobacteria bacterium]
MPEAATALYGAWRLACLDRGGIAFFARGEAAFWRSFRAAFLLYPAFLFMVALAISDEEWRQADLLRVFLVETIGYVIGWTAFPLAMLWIARFLGREPLWLFFIIVYNWSQILRTTLDLAATAIIAGGLVPDIGKLWLAQLVYLAEFLYEWFIVRTVLNVSGLAATMVVLADFVLGMLIVRVADFLR